MPTTPRTARIYHLAKKIRADGAVSAMCFVTNRAIDMSRATWTTDRKAVTCPKCQKIIKHLMSGANLSIEAVKALDGKIFAMLSPDEEATLDFYRTQGRKYGVAVSIINGADPEELARAPSRLQADQILKRANSRVRVTIA